MSAYVPHYISSYENDTGLFTYFEPFLAPEKAFPVMEDCYAWRGRIRRRQGYTFLGRLRRSLTTIAMGNITAAGAGTFDFNIFTGLGLLVTEPNANIELGSLTPITIAIGAPISQSLTNATGTQTMTVVGAGPITAATINYATGVLSITFSGAAGVSAATFTGAYYPGLPVMGLPTRQILTNTDTELDAFDTKYAYQFVNGTGLFQELPSTAPTTWQGADHNLFWTTNYYLLTNNNLFWTTNFNKSGTPDPIRYYDGTTWTTFAPTINGGNELHQALILLPYKNRLLAFNTYEGATLAASTQFPQRLRFSQNGDPTDQVNGWRDDIVGRGGFIDAPTNEPIVSTEFIKDTLVVKFRQSSWKILYTGNETLPFVWQKINTELGAQSTFSNVPFDRGIFTVGTTGITTDDSVNVERIDQVIPNQVFKFNSDNFGDQRVYGIRDFAQQLALWAYPDDSGSAPDIKFPNKILVYNYVNNSYALFNDSFTAFGYFTLPTDYTWATLPYATWDSWNVPWGSPQQSTSYPNIVGGNQEGYVSILNQHPYNDRSLYISAIIPGNPVQLTVINHNLDDIDLNFVQVENIIGTGAGSTNPNTLNDGIFGITRIDADTISLQQYNTTTGQMDNVNLPAGGTYFGGGELIPINNINLHTKVFAPYYEIAQQCRLPYIDFLLENTEDGEISIDLFINEDDSTSLSDPDSPGNDGILGTNVVNTKSNPQIPFQEAQDKIWQRFFTSVVCQNFQLKFFLSNRQMSDTNINSSDFVLHAMTLYLSNNARMTQ